MFNQTRLVRAWLSIALILLPIATYADQYSDDLGKCLVNNSSSADRTIFVKWIFATMALHPDVASMANISEVQRDALNQKAAALFTKLLTQTCQPQAQQAMLFDGPRAIGSAFEVLGRSATLSLMTNDKVTTGMQGFSKYMDQQKIMKALDGAQPAHPQ